MKNFVQRSLFLMVATVAIVSSAFGMNTAALDYLKEVGWVKKIYVQAEAGTALEKDLKKLLWAAINQFGDLAQIEARARFSDTAKIAKLGLNQALSKETGFNSYDYAKQLLTELLKLDQTNYSQKADGILTYGDVETMAKDVVLGEITREDVNSSVTHLLLDQLFSHSLKLYNEIAKEVTQEDFDKTDNGLGLDIWLRLLNKEWGGLILARINKMMQREKISMSVYRECVQTLDYIIEMRLSEFDEEFQLQIRQCAITVLDHIANQNEPLILVNFPSLMSIVMHNFNMHQAVYELVVNKKILDKVDLINDNPDIGVRTFFLIENLLRCENLTLGDDFYKIAFAKVTKSKGERDTQTKAMRRRMLLEALTEKVMAMGADGYKFIESLVAACVKSLNPSAINNACKLLTEVIGKYELNNQIFINTAKLGIVIDIYNENRNANLRGHVLALWKALFERRLGFEDANNLIENTVIEKRGSSWILTNQDGFVGLVRILLEFRSKDQTLTNERAFAVVDKFYPRTDQEYCDLFLIFEHIVGSLDQKQKTYVQTEVEKYLSQQLPSYFNSEVFKAMGGLLAILFTINRNDKLDELCLSFVVKCALSEDLPVRNAGIDFLKSEHIRTAFFDKLKSIVDDRFTEIQEKFDLITSQNGTEVLNQKMGIIKGYMSVLYIYTLLLQVDALQSKEIRMLTADYNKKIFSLVSLLLENHNFNSWNVMQESCGVLRLLEAFILWFDKDILKTKLLLMAAIKAVKSSSEMVRSYAIGVLVAYAHKVKNGKDEISRIHQDLVNGQVDAETCQTLLDAITANTLEAGFTLTETFIGVTQARAKNKTMVNKEIEKVDKERNERETMLYQTLMAPSKIKLPVKQANPLIAGELNLDKMVQSRKNNIPAVNDEQLKNATRQELEAALLQRTFVLENAKNYTKIQQMYLDLKRMDNEINLIKNKLNEIK